ncbi:GntR family transcriptional regulator [Actinoallomurus purpureus]|uniref:GntR family transcriptional regulator n=1 Tax=Actinoallomurus purpureus TaxID=478114 RepID=UPI00209331A2|nr:GntR family transcriptional regulator [Actinoallomurus purpureus]MCO6006881.1 GntR family transcriptional regulator [Actinoallomurus purpureus]
MTAAGNGRSEAGAAQYERLRDDVLAGRFPAGSVLLETTLAARYGVSRTPVREALGRLEQDGLLKRAARGYQVRAGTSEDVLEIYEARIALEAQAAASAALRRTDLDLARLRHLHATAGERTDPAEIRELNAQWHATLWQAGHNTTIQTLLTRLTAQLRIYDRGSHESAEDLEITRDEHERVLTAIADRDSEAARDALAAHLGRSRESRLAAFARDSL